MSAVAAAELTNRMPPTRRQIRVKPAEGHPGTDDSNLLGEENPLAVLAEDARKAFLEGKTEDWRVTMKWLKGRRKQS